MAWLHAVSLRHALDRAGGTTDPRGAREEAAAARRYGLAVLSVAAAVAMTVLLHNIELRGANLFFFYLAVMASVWFGGTGPGFVAVGLSTLVVEYFCAPPLYSVEVNREDVPWFIAFVIGAMASLALSAHRKHAETDLLQARNMLEARVEERTAELRQANDALRIEIAERQHAEAGLRRSEALLAQGQRLSHTGSWTWNAGTGEMRWSAELFALFGLDPGANQPLFRSFVERLHAEDRDEFEQILRCAVAQQHGFSHECRVVPAGAMPTPVQILGEPDRNRADVVEYIGTVMDLSERKAGERALQDAQAELARVLRRATVAELAGGIAHEINQPLAAIVANGGACLRWLAREPAAIGEARGAVASIVADGNRAGDIIGRIRSLLSHGPTWHVTLDANQVVRDALALVRTVLQRQGIPVRTRLARSLPAVVGDAVQLQQVMLNLIGNAVEAMAGHEARPPLLTICSRHDRAGFVVVKVEDSGPGLGKTDIDRVFDSFYTTKSDGLGMGLSISRSIIEAHHGRLWASPRARNGARFELSLPVALARSA